MAGAQEDGPTIARTAEDRAATGTAPFGSACSEDARLCDVSHHLPVLDAGDPRRGFVSLPFISPFARQARHLARQRQISSAADSWFGEFRSNRRLVGRRSVIRGAAQPARRERADKGASCPPATRGTSLRHDPKRLQAAFPRARNGGKTGN